MCVHNIALKGVLLELFIHLGISAHKDIFRLYTYFRKPIIKFMIQHNINGFLKKSYITTTILYYSGLNL